MNRRHKHKGDESPTSSIVDDANDVGDVSNEEVDQSAAVEATSQEEPTAEAQPELPESQETEGAETEGEDEVVADVVQSGEELEAMDHDADTDSA